MHHSTGIWKRHLMGNLEPFRYGSADFIQKSVQAILIVENMARTYWKLLNRREKLHQNFYAGLELPMKTDKR